MNDFVPTNTMALSSFDVLKMDGIDDPLINVNKLATLDLEESYFASAVKFISESNKEYTDCKISLYKALSESSDQYVVLESFSDFFSKVKEIIDKFLKFIKSLFDRFITNLMKLVDSDKYIIKHKEKLKSFTVNDEFEFSGYKFTITPNVPVPNAIFDFNSDLIFGDLTVTNGGITAASVKNDISTNSNNRDDKCDIFRGKVLGKDTVSISAYDFSEELYRTFRDDCLDTYSITATSLIVNQALYRFENYKKSKETVEKTRRDIEKAYELVKKQVQNVTKRNGDLNISAFVAAMPDNKLLNANKIENNGLNMSAELLTQVDIYTKDRVDLIQEYTNIHTLAFGAKLDAMKACYDQDRNILYTALNRIQRTDYVRGIK